MPEEPEETPPPPPPPAESPPPNTLFDRNGAARLNNKCTRYLNPSRLWSATLAQCMSEDCEQALDTRTGCRFLDEHGFCYRSRSAQQWCARQAGAVAGARQEVEEQRGVCKDGGADWAVAPVGSAESREQVAWRPMSTPGWVCACMKDCTCSDSECRCKNEATFPTGDGGYLFLSALSEPIKQSNYARGKCSCRCEQTGVGEAAGAA